MSFQVVHAKPGHRFILTYPGRKQKAIAVKFQENGDSIYFTCVPKRWVTDGFVIEVKDNDTMVHGPDGDRQ